jgi:hypothetical protein
MAKLKDITPYMAKKIRENLRMYFDLASQDQIESGKHWYYNAHDICTELAGKHYTTEQVAGVISALSPRNKWERNIIDAGTVLRAVNDGLLPEYVKVCTFNTNKFKAFEIAKGNRTITDVSRKTYAFIRNIAGLDPDRVTVDVWHLRACFGKTIDTGLTPKRYDIIEAITLDEAKRVGLKGFEYQAIIWEVVRDRNDF